MALIMGIDTGGTYTDGVIFDTAANRILSKAKTFTTKQDLTIGIRECIEKLDIIEPGKLEYVSISTTLATNAIVEGRGGNVGLLLIGKSPEGKLPVDRWILLQGKLDIKGKLMENIAEEEVYKSIESFRGHVDAIAVSCYASVRNPSLELQVRQMIQEQSDIPVVCAHELTSSLGFHDRTVTAVLNARLIPIINGLIKAIKSVLKEKSIDAPIMLVKGDGSLMQESFAMERPIETILSGPAASILGGMYLTNQKEALILDMGGTTTDIAYVLEGKAKISKKGVRVGGWFTQVQAAEICTFGIGGDSYLHFNADSKLEIGPHKVEPLCVAGHKHPYLFHELGRIIKDKSFELYSEQEVDCFSFVRRPENGELSAQDERIIGLLADGPHSLFHIAGKLGKDVETLGLSRLVNQGVLARISMTPTDVLCALGRYDFGNDEISKLGAEILAAKMGKTAPEFLKEAVSSITDALSISLLQSIVYSEEQDFSIKESKTAMYFINKAVKADKGMLLEMDLTVRKPVVAIGAPVTAWMPAVCNRLHTGLIIPEHAEVANAIGAAVGQVMETVEALIRPGEGHEGYILHAPWERKLFDTLEEAMEYTVRIIRQYAADLAIKAGSSSFEIVEVHEDIYLDVFGTNTKDYIETRVKATAIGSRGNHAYRRLEHESIIAEGTI